MTAYAAARAAPAVPEAPASSPIRVMIVDDSIVARAVLARILASAVDIEVVAQAGTGRTALRVLAETPVDLILLDLEMPDMGGLEALPQLIEASGARVLVLSSAAEPGAMGSATALRLGATDTLLKPAIGVVGGAFAANLLDRVRRAALAATRAPVDGRPGDPQPVPAGGDAAPLACLAIGASTGGVHALAEFFAGYPEGCTAPILITQHLPEAFMPYFAGQLEGMARRPAVVAGDGMTLRPGTILLAPGDASIALRRTRGRVHICLERTRSASGFLPSADPMFASAGAMFGGEALGVVLSGMGRDGLAGATALVEAGGEMLVQDAGSSVVWGMPGVVARAGLASAVLKPALLADRVARRQLLAESR